MATRPLSIGILTLVSAIIGAGTFALDPDPFDQPAAVLVLGGIIIAGLTGLVGLVLARSPWGRWSLLGTMGIGLVLASIPGSWGFWLALATGGLAAVGLMGPWLRLWVRHEPVADAPGPIVVALVTAAPVAPLFIGITALGGLRIAHVALIAVVMVASWAYARGVPGGIWGLRIAVPLAGVVATVVTVGVGQYAIGIAVAAVTIGAWLPQARHATAVITPPLPEPVQRTHRSSEDAAD